MSNGAGAESIDRGENELANALVDSLTAGIVNRDDSGTFLIDRDSAAGLRLTERIRDSSGGWFTYGHHRRNSIPICR